ncbi:MAG: DUF1385 domain-containing protein [Lachnospiraceae bacterium]|nr:DUF1385 domain-containing protein [Lachnospiraceae bacterium]
MKASGIGGQAVMEGVMMKNGDNYAVAVRKNEEEIVVEKREHVSLTKRIKFFGLPVIRGVIIFGESLGVGVKTLTYSARIYEEETEGDSPKKDDPKSKTKEDAVMAGTVVLSVLIAVALFMMFPYFASRLLATVIESEFLLALCEGIIRVTLFVVYIASISLMKDIKRVFMYHGAEHKSINCVENGFPLTVENVRAQSREHKRCGTSFMLYVMVLSVLFFMFIRFDNSWLRIIARLVLIPVIAGVSYEFIRLAGRTENPVITALSKPGLLLQRLTTREPDDDMIEVAITSVEAVFDWKEFVDSFTDKERSAKATAAVEAAGTPVASEAEEKLVEKSEGKTADKPDKGTGNRNKKKHKKHNRPDEAAVEVTAEASVVANVRIGGIADPIQDLDDDLDFAVLGVDDDEPETGAVEEPMDEAEAERTESVTDGSETVETASEPEKAETQEAASEPEKAEAREAASEPEEAEVQESKSEQEKTGAEKSEPTQAKAETVEGDRQKTENKSDSKDDDGDNLGYFRGRRSPGKKNTGMDRAPEPTKGVNHRAPLEVEKRAVIVEDDDEDDEILKGLDRYFVNKNKKD